VIPFSESADHVGFFTQDIAGVKLAAAVLCHNWNTQKIQPRKKAVLGIPEGKYLYQAEQDTLNVFAEIVKALEQADYLVKCIPLLDKIEEINQRHRMMIAAEMALAHAKWFEQYQDLYSDLTKEIIVQGQQIDQKDLEEAKAGRIGLRAELESVKQAHDIDLWISPSAVSDAPKGLHSTGNPIMNLPWTYAGLPTLSIPAAVSQNGLPLGLQITASFEGDESLVQCAAGIQQAFVL
jgi:Asp-tRNA(Asn)/Glu-tRNA(Gln) amidotransferase A subunit family amidase